MHADRLARVAAVLTDQDDRPVLERLLDASVEMLDADGAGIAIISEGQHQGALALSAGTLDGVDELQFTLGEGPCLDADRSARPVLEGDLAACAARWPVFVPEAMARGVYAVFAFPMRIGSIRMGVYSIYRDRPERLADEDIGDALAICQVATHLLLDLEEDLNADALPAQLEDVIGQRREIHQATGMVAAQLGLSPNDAMARLRAYSWAQERTIHEVALDVVTGALRFTDQ
ncbi:GAF and ANTAR domain-containing protein [Actinospongicola halichondriae]|uniref:GAF and ANTAR domain-containing protein n=1 Tax=Actinospongicola halichondriae TaxID=3236844 RepID=UPI003D48425A